MGHHLWARLTSPPKLLRLSHPAKLLHLPPPLLLLPPLPLSPSLLPPCSFLLLPVKPPPLLVLSLFLQSVETSRERQRSPNSVATPPCGCLMICADRTARSDWSEREIGLNIISASYYISDSSAKSRCTQKALCCLRHAGLQVRG